MIFNNILVVSNVKSDIRDISDVLIEHDMLVCSDSGEAIRLCAENDIYLVIIEEELPGMSGSRLFADLRNKQPGLIGVLIADKPDEKLLRRALDIGFTGLLEKPIEPTKLLQLIYRAIEVKTTHEEKTRLSTLLPLYNYGERFLKARSDEDIYEGLVDVVFDVTKANRISLMLYDEGEECLKIVSSKGIDPKLVKAIRVRPGDQVAGWVFLHGEPVILNKGSQEDSIFAPLLKRQEITAAISYPIAMDDRVVGVLNISHQREEVRFLKSDIELLAILCSQAVMALAHVRYRIAVEEKTRMRTLLQQYVSPEVAELLMKSGTDLVGVGEIKNVTIFFADIRESTALVQLLPLDELRAFLNEFFHMFTEGIFQNRGTVDKFMGDAVLAIFGAPIELENPNLTAVKAALEIRGRFDQLKSEWVIRHEEFNIIDLAIGVTCGEVFLGNVGSSNRFDYTVLGAAVNVAQRIAAASPAGDVHITREVRDGIKGVYTTEEVGSMRLRGLRNPVTVYAAGKDQYPDRLPVK